MNNCKNIPCYSTIIFFNSKLILWIFSFVFIDFLFLFLYHNIINSMIYGNDKEVEYN